MRETYHLAWMTAEDIGNKQATTIDIKPHDMVLLLGSQTMEGFDQQTIVAWHVFHLTHQRNYWIVTDIEPLEST